MENAADGNGDQLIQWIQIGFIMFYHVATSLEFVASSLTWASKKANV